MTRAAHWFFLSGLLLAGILLTHYAPPSAAQFTPPALPRAYADIATPSTNPKAGFTTAYTKGGTVCGLSSAGAETCTGTGGTTVTVAPPFFVIGGTSYTSAGYAVTKPSAAPAFLSSTATTAAGPNGDLVLTSCADDCFVSLNGTTSVESEFTCAALQSPSAGAFSHCAVWLWDSTNNLIYTFYPSYADRLNGGTVIWFFQQWTYNGAGNPVFSATLNSIDLNYVGYSAPAHLKLSVAGGTVTAALSLNGGASFFTAATHAIGSVTKGGYEVSTTAVMDVNSIKVQ